VGVFATASGQVGFFDAAELARPLPAGSFFALLAEHGDRIVRDEDFAACYSAGMGRPSIPPSQLAKVLLLQYRTGVSDEQAMECVAWDLRWKIALGVAVDHEGWHPTSLTRFRARLLLHRLERVAFGAHADGGRGVGDARWAGRADHRLHADARRGRHAGHRPAGPSRRARAAGRGQSAG
jgi:transposase